MGIGTIDRTPPPFFRQGLSALTKLILCSALALFLMVADNRFALTRQLRAVVATALYYPEQVLLVPVQAVAGAAGYFIGLKQALADQETARRELTRQSERALRVEQLLQENSRLRALLELRATLQVRSQAAQVLYEASDPYSRKVVIDRGSTNGVVLASPVINEGGVLGQVTRVFPLSSEVTLLVDKDAAIPVLNTRTQARSAAFGSASVVGGAMEMRFMAGNADVRPGDALTTSGVDGIYPPGLPVATVASVDRKADTGFARIVLLPIAHPDGVRHVLVLEPVGVQMPARADAAPPDESRPASGAANGRKAGKAAAAAAEAARAASAAAAAAVSASAAASTPALAGSPTAAIAGSRPAATATAGMSPLAATAAATATALAAARASGRAGDGRAGMPKAAASAPGTAAAPHPPASAPKGVMTPGPKAKVTPTGTARTPASTPAPAATTARARAATSGASAASSPRPPPRPTNTPPPLDALLDAARKAARAASAPGSRAAPGAAAPAINGRPAPRVPSP